MAFQTSLRRLGVIQSDQGFTVATPRRYELVYTEEPDVSFTFGYETTPPKVMLIWARPVKLSDGSLTELDSLTLDRVLGNIQRAFEWRGFTVEIARP